MFDWVLNTPLETIGMLRSTRQQYTYKEKRFVWPLARQVITTTYDFANQNFVLAGEDLSKNIVTSIPPSFKLTEWEFFKNFDI